MVAARALMWQALALLVLVSPVAAGEQLKAGDEAPDFEMTGSDGKVYKLADFAGEKVVVLAWFPKAFTGGCTKECKSFRDNIETIKKYDVAYFTASCDTVDDNTKFAKQLELNYPILSDPEKNIAKAYGVVDEKRSVPYRWTFYIGTDGKLLKVDREINTSTAGEDLAKTLDELGVEKN